MRKKLLTVYEVAEEMGLTPGRIRQFCSEGRLGQKHGTVWVIQRGELNKFKRIPRKHGGRRR